MIYNRLLLSLLILGMLLFVGCTNDVSESLKSVPNAYGEINELVVIADQYVWDGPVGDSLRFYYSSAYPILPQPEPLLDLRHFTPEELLGDPLRKELRTYLIIANLGDKSSVATQLVRRDVGDEKLTYQRQEDPEFNTLIGRNKWAKGQLIIYLFGDTEAEIIQNLKTNFSGIINKIREHDRTKIDATVYLDGENATLQQEVEEKIGVDMKIPGEYFQAISDGNIVWMRKETSKSSSNLILKRLDYPGPEVMSKENIKAIRDSIGREYVSSTLPNTFMRVNDEDLPMLTNVTQIDGKYALEARGIWEVENDFMGGAFVSYLIHDPVNQDVVFVDGFIHAPGEDKRNFIQYLEHIIRTIDLPQ